LSAGASPQTPLGELTALPQTPIAALRGPTSKGRGREGWGEERKGWEGREGRGQAPPPRILGLEPPLFISHGIQLL